MVQLQLRSTQTSAQTVDLYDCDFYAWLQTTTQLLREHRYAEIDTEHLATELEQLQRQERRSLKRLFIQLIVALLGLQVDQSQAQLTLQEIQRLRYQVLDQLSDSPSLTEFLQAHFDALYVHAQQQALEQLLVGQQELPEHPPFELAQVLDTEFFPEVD